MSLFISSVLKWQTDSWKRIHGTSSTYLLNTYAGTQVERIDSVIEKDGDCTRDYFDNPFDERDRGNYMVLDMSLADLMTEWDTAPTHLYMTLSIFPNNDHNLTPVDTVIAVANFTAAIADWHDHTHSWVAYTEGGWDIKKVLCNNTIAALHAMA